MPLFNNPKKETWIILAFILLFIVALTVSSRANSAEMEISYGKTIVRGQADVLALTAVFPRQQGATDLFAGMMLVGSYDYSNYRTMPNQVFLRAGMTPHVGKWGFTLGVVAKQHNDVINSGMINFNLGIDYHVWSGLRLAYNHISNAGTSEPNIGRDMILASWRF